MDYCVGVEVRGQGPRFHSEVAMKRESHGMKGKESLADRLGPDTIAKLVRAAEQRFATAEFLRTQPARWLAALYFYGYSAEMWISAAFYRSAGFRPHDPIDRDTRHRRMIQARQLRLMNGDPHPLVGWARFLEWHRSASELSVADAQRLKEVIDKAIQIYNHWRPELRYKIVQVTESQLSEVRRAVAWLRDNQDRF